MKWGPLSEEPHTFLTHLAPYFLLWSHKLLWLFSSLCWSSPEVGRRPLAKGTFTRLVLGKMLYNRAAALCVDAQFTKPANQRNYYVCWKPPWRKIWKSLKINDVKHVVDRLSTVLQIDVSFLWECSCAVQETHSAAVLVERRLAIVTASLRDATAVSRHLSLRNLCEATCDTIRSSSNSTY